MAGSDGYDEVQSDRDEGSERVAAAPYSPYCVVVCRLVGALFERGSIGAQFRGAHSSRSVARARNGAEQAGRVWFETHSCGHFGGSRFNDNRVSTPATI
jgi:hypothetical protein